MTGLYSYEFAQAFSKLLEKAGVSRYQINQFSYLDQAYLSRLMSGEKYNPTPETIVKICLALVHFNDKISLYDLEELFRSVGRSLLIKA